MKDNEFVFDHVDGLHYKFNEISLNRGGYCIYSHVWLKNKKVKINLKIMMVIVFNTLKKFVKS